MGYRTTVGTSRGDLMFWRIFIDPTIEESKQRVEFARSHGWLWVAEVAVHDSRPVSYGQQRLLDYPDYVREPDPNGPFVVTREEVETARRDRRERLRRERAGFRNSLWVLIPARKAKMKRQEIEDHREWLTGLLIAIAIIGGLFVWGYFDLRNIETYEECVQRSVEEGQPEERARRFCGSTESRPDVFWP